MGRAAVASADDGGGGGGRGEEGRGGVAAWQTSGQLRAGAAASKGRPRRLNST